MCDHVVPQKALETNLQSCTWKKNTTGNEWPLKGHPALTYKMGDKTKINKLEQLQKTTEKVKRVGNTG